MVQNRKRVIFVIISVFAVCVLFLTSTKQDELRKKEVAIENIDTYLKKQSINCSNRQLHTHFDRRGDFIVFYNFVKADISFKCDESVTLTSPADVRFLENIPFLVEAWKGPVSVALYSPGDDFFITLSSIVYLRQCETSLIRDFVTFHVFFDQQHVPQDKNTGALINSFRDYGVFDCGLGAPFSNIGNVSLYKNENKLLYPINVARNIARENVQTHFVFASDVELFPTPNFIPKFLEMLRKNPDLVPTVEKRQVFVLPVFEIYEDQKVPKTKTRLLEMQKNETAFLFHEKLCRPCHKVIEGDRWLKTEETEGLGVFSSGKRQGKYKSWEPFYISTNFEPSFDERLTWEGQNNKLIQGYTMCLLDYDYMVLDNAFLIHKPGVKKKKEQNIVYRNVVRKTNILLKTVILKELDKIFGPNQHCKV